MKGREFCTVNVQSGGTELVCFQRSGRWVTSFLRSKRPLVRVQPGVPQPPFVSIRESFPTAVPSPAERLSRANFVHILYRTETRPTERGARDLSIPSNATDECSFGSTHPGAA